MRHLSYKLGILSGNVLKIIAAISMLIDHIGMLFFPTQLIYRKIGRIACPIFAYFIAEGCKYTKSKIRYFSVIFVLGVFFQVVFYIAQKSLYMNIFITFSVAIVVTYCLQNFKKTIINKCGLLKISLSGLLFALSIIFAYYLNQNVTIEGGFWACMLPVFASLFMFEKPEKAKYKLLEKIDCVPLSLIPFAICLVFMSNFIGELQYYSLFSILFLLFYSGKKGKYNIKYFFYVFYPFHLVLLYVIYYLVYAGFYYTQFI